MLDDDDAATGGASMTATAVHDAVTGRSGHSDAPVDGGSGGRATTRVPTSGPRRLFRDIGVTFLVFFCAVALVAAGLWMRDAAREGETFLVLATPPPAPSTDDTVAGTAPPAGNDAVPGPTPDSTTDAAPGDGQTPDHDPTTARADATDAPGGPTGAPTSPVAEAEAWVPVVEELDPTATRAVAERRAAAVTSLGYPAEPARASDLAGLDGDWWVLVGVPRASRADALATCEGRDLLATCRAHRLPDGDTG